MATKNEKDEGEWFLDSGCSRHMTSYKELFNEFNNERQDEKVVLGDNKELKIEGSGSILIKNKV